MINNSALSSQMNVADLAPKAATKQLPERQGDNAFGEALAGAHTVHDRRESQAADNSRRDWAQGDRSTERTRGQDRANEVRSDKSDRAARPDTAGTDTTATETDSAADASTPTASTDDTSATTSTQTDQSDDATTATAEAGIETDAAATTAQATVAVAAAPVITDLDAIIVPTSTTITQVATDAIDAAIKLAIDADAAVTATTDAAKTTTVAATTTTAVAAATDVDVDAQLVTAANAQGAEDAETGDVQAGPTRPTTSTPITSSGPSPVQLAAATFTADADASVATTTAQVAQVATSDVVDVAAGTTKDAAATQLVQAAAAEVDSDAAPDEVVVADDAVALKAKTDATATQVATNVDAELVDAEDPDVVQAARLNQTQAPTVAVNAQVQAKAAEQAAEEGADDAAPAKLEPLPSQAAPIATAARGEGVGATARMREGLQAQVQERIDHIAEQLATRLRLSHAAGGSQVQLSLKPRELGEVTVQMNVREGAVAATILVDKADTLRTLQTNIEDLKKSLEAQGLQIGEFSVDVRGDSGAGGANARAAADLNANGRRSSNASNGASIAGAAAATPGLSGDRTVSAEEAHDGDVSVLA